MERGTTTGSAIGMGLDEMLMQSEVDSSVATEAVMAPTVPVTTSAILPIDPAGFEGPLPRALRSLGRRQELRTPMAIDDRRRIISALFGEGPAFQAFGIRFAVLMGISVGIAVLGLVSDSTAVVIGAMLVAPLLTPTLGIAAAVVMGWPRRIGRSAATVAFGALGAIALAAAMSAALPFDLDPLPGELLARTHPNMLDLGIALGAGAAGSFALVRRKAADAMSGAAVAVALVPPLSCVGVLLQQAEWDLALGALLLFTTNIAGVVMAGAVVFVAGGFVPGVQLFYGARRTVGRIRWVVLATLIVIVSLNGNRTGILHVVPAVDEVAQIVEEWRGAGVDVVDIVMDVEDGEADVELLVATDREPPDLDALAVSLAESLGRPVMVELQIVASRRASASAEATDP